MPQDAHINSKDAAAPIGSEVPPPVHERPVAEIVKQAAQARDADAGNIGKHPPAAGGRSQK